VIVAGNPEHGHAIAAGAGCIFNPACDRVIANARGEKLLGGVIYQGFKGASIGIHAAGFDPHWLSNDMLWISFSYPFEQLNVSKLIAQVPSSNRKALEFDLKLGFKEEARIADAFIGADLLVLTMRRENCRWLKLKPRGASNG